MSTETSSTKLAWALVWLAFIAVAVAVRSMALADAWLWFVVPLGAPPITAWHALGLVVLGGIARGRTDLPESRRREKTMRELAMDVVSKSAGGALVAWGIAWCVAQAVAR